MDNIAITTNNTTAETKRIRSNPHQLLFLVLNKDQNGDPDRTIFVAKRAMDVQDYIYKGIKSRKFTYNRDSETKHPPIQAQYFLDDWEAFKGDRKQLNAYLGGCFLDTCYAGRDYTPPEKEGKHISTKSDTKRNRGLFAMLRRA